MANDIDKLTTHVAAHAMRFIRNDGDPREDLCLLELSDFSEQEVELAFTLHRDRYYVRVRRDDLARLLAGEGDG